MEPYICNECKSKIFDPILNYTETCEEIPYCSIECLKRNRKNIKCVQCCNIIKNLAEVLTIKCILESKDILYMDFCSRSCAEECKKRMTRTQPVVEEMDDEPDDAKSDDEKE